MDNEIFKQNNLVHAAKLEYTNCGKNVNGSPALIQKFLI